VTFTVEPLTPARFEDFADVVNPNRRATHCWCLSHRLPAREIEELGHGSREQAMRALSARRSRPGVIGYADGTPVGWVHISPRSEIPRLVSSTLITRRGAPAVEAYPVDAEGGRIDTTMAFVGTRAMFERAGFVVVGETRAVASGRPRLVMRRLLDGGG
jgi:hypothetical protein